MKMRYIEEVKKNISIYATKKATNILDGTYLSIFKGRTQNFEDLRLYVSGDNVKDIDWKSSARSQTLLVRRYIAEKKHNVLIVLDNGKKMLADTNEGESKLQVALGVAAAIGYIANRNGDYVRIAYRKEHQIKLSEKQEHLYGIERLLAHYEADGIKYDEENMESTLLFLNKKLKERSIIFLITDSLGMKEISSESLRKLTSRNDVLCICIEDGLLTGKRAFDVEKDQEIPEVIRKNKKLAKYEEKYRKQLMQECEQKFMQNQIICTNISTKKEIIHQLIELLGGHKHANRR